MTGEEHGNTGRIKKYIAIFEVTDRDLEEHTPEHLRKIVEERSNYVFPDGTHIKLRKIEIAETKITNEQIMGDPRFWELEMDDMNKKDMQDWVDKDQLVALVDENHGGIIGYVNREHSQGLLKQLNK